MREQLRKMWESRSRRDRLVILIVAAVVGAVLYLWLVQAATGARARLGSSVAALREQAARLERDATELGRVRAQRVPPPPSTDLRTQVQTQAAAAGLAGALLRIDATDANQVQVVFGSIAFADWLRWVTALQAQNIRLSTGRIEALSTPGLVGVTSTFARAKPQ